MSAGCCVSAGLNSGELTCSGATVIIVHVKHWCMLQEPANLHADPLTKCTCLQAAVELCWLSCVSSELNGEELTRSRGVDILGALLARCCTVMPKDVAPNQPNAVIACHALRSLAGMAIFANAKSELTSRYVFATFSIGPHLDLLLSYALLCSCYRVRPCTLMAASENLMWTWV